MRILVLGGTWFLGKSVVLEALRRGWDVTAFSRGRSGQDVPGVRPVRGDRTEAADLNRLADAGPWDAVIDTSSSEPPPRDVRLAARALCGAVGRWVHVSTVSVYAGWPHQPLTEACEILECPSDADESFGYTGADGSPTKYGFQKAGGERAVAEAFGKRAVFLRPGVILGPGEYVGRLPWWLNRAHQGGTVLAPLQPIDTSSRPTYAMSRPGPGSRDNRRRLQRGPLRGDDLRGLPAHLLHRHRIGRASGMGGAGGAHRA